MTSLHCCSIYFPLGCVGRKLWATVDDCSTIPVLVPPSTLSVPDTPPIRQVVGID